MNHFHDTNIIGAMVQQDGVNDIGVTYIEGNGVEDLLIKKINSKTRFICNKKNYKYVKFFFLQLVLDVNDIGVVPPSYK